MASRGWAHGVGRAMFSSVSGTGHGLPRAHSALGRMRLPVATEPSARHTGRYNGTAWPCVAPRRSRWLHGDAARAWQACPSPVKVQPCSPRPSRRGAGSTQLPPCVPAARAHGTGIRRAPHSACEPLAARPPRALGLRSPHGPSPRYPVYRRIKMLSLPLMHRLLPKKGGCCLQGNWSHVLGDPWVRGLLGHLDHGLQSPPRGAPRRLTPA